MNRGKTYTLFLGIPDACCKIWRNLSPHMLAASSSVGSVYKREAQLVMQVIVSI
jgi:hypothetical protein